MGIWGSRRVQLHMTVWVCSVQCVCLCCVKGTGHEPVVQGVWVNGMESWLRSLKPLCLRSHSGRGSEHCPRGLLVSVYIPKMYNGKRIYTLACLIHIYKDFYLECGGKVMTINIQCWNNNLHLFLFLYNTECPYEPFYDM